MSEPAAPKAPGPEDQPVVASAAARSTARWNVDRAGEQHASPNGSVLPETGHPRPLTSLIGREDETAAILAILAEDAEPPVRLLTLIGPGGVGKTRLALHVGERLAVERRLRTCFVPLDGIAEAARALPAIGRALGVREDGAQPLLERLARLLGDERRAVVLDTFEHVLAAAPEIAALLGACPNLTVIATSRARLRVSGEHVLPIAPLATPPPGGVAAAEIASFAAVALFVERARAADPSFELTPTNAAAVAELCRRLDGLPLAIELAAARGALLPPHVMLAQLDARLPVLADGPRDQPARLRTMRDAIAWSYALLDPEEQALFRRLAVFSGGFSIEAARAVDESDAAAALTKLAALVDHNLVQRQSDPSDELRFRLLDTIRDYGRAQLLASGEEPSVRDAHARVYLAMAEDAPPSPFDPAVNDWLRRLDADLPNLRQALAWLQESGDAEAFLRLAAALRFFWWVRGPAREGGAWLATALAQADAKPSPARVAALLSQGELALLYGGYAEVEAPLLACLSLALEAGDRVTAAFALNGLAMADIHLGQFARAEERLRKQLELARSLGEPSGPAARLTGFAFFNLGMAKAAQGEPALAEQLLESALRLQTEHGDRWGAGFTTWALGNARRDRGDERRALADYRASLEIARDFRDQQLLAYNVAAIAGLAAGTLPEHATRLFGAAEAIRDAVGMPVIPQVRADQQRREAAVRSALGAATATAFWNEGRALSIDDAAGAAFATASMLDRGPAAAPTGITRREGEVLRLLAEGRTDREIAEALFIGRRTVETHVSSLLAKLGLSSRAALAAHAVRHGLA